MDPRTDATIRFCLDKNEKDKAKVRRFHWVRVSALVMGCFIVLAADEKPSFQIAVASGMVVYALLLIYKQMRLDSHQRERGILATLEATGHLRSIEEATATPGQAEPKDVTYS